MKLGIIGYGGMAHWHRFNAPKAKGVTVAAAFDIDEEQVKKAITDGLKGYYTLSEFLNDKEIDTVLVATPNDVHKELAISALNAGKHVICEKPVAMSTAEVDEIIAASKKNNRVFTVHQNRRWDKDFLIVKEVFRQGLLGDVFTVESRNHGSGGLIHGWRAYPQYGGGMVLDWGVHFLDQFLQLIPSKVKTVYADLHSVKNPLVDDYFKIILKFENGVTALTELGTFILKPLPRWFAAGNEGTLIINDFSGEGSITRSTKLAETIESVIVQTPAGPTRTFAPQPKETKEEIALPEVIGEWTEFYENVANHIEGKAELIVKPEEIRRVMALMEAIFESAKTNQTVNFE